MSACDDPLSEAARRRADDSDRNTDSTVAVPRPPRCATSLPTEIGPIRLIREIGRGGMGEVWLGRHSLLARDVAVKFLLNAVLGSDDPHFERFLQEARTAATVRHPHLVVVHDANLVGQVPYLVMEYIDGPTLTDVLRRRGNLGLSETLGVLDAVAPAVAELHQRAIVHRDIKPSNILLGRDGRVVVSDFGLACTWSSKSGDASFGGVAGTPAYMAPEMFEGTATPRSDVYALGVMAFQLLTGELPFSGTLEEVRRMHVSDPFPEVKLVQRHVETPVIEVLSRAAHKNATLRYKTAAHVLRALKEAVPNERVWSQGAAELMDEAAGHEPRSAAKAVPETKTPSSASYYDHLATIAATKRQRQDGNQPPEAASRAPEPAEAQAPARTLAVDLPCARCDYNLRGLETGGACPECGVPLVASLAPDRLLFADAAWLRRVATGLTSMGWMVLGGLGLLLVATPVQYNGYEVIGPLGLVCFIVIAAAVYSVTALDPKRRRAANAGVARQIARWLALGAVLAMLVGAVPPFGRAWSDGFGLVALILCAACFIALLPYLGTLAGRIPNRKMVQDWVTARFLFIVIGAAVVVFAVLLEGVRALGLRPRSTPVTETVLFCTMIASLALVPWFGLKLLGFGRTFKRLAAGHVPPDALFVGSIPPSPVVCAEGGPAKKGARGVLALSRCPQCDYSLEGLPRRYRCPECAFEYDESMFMIYGWATKRHRPGFLVTTTGTSSPIMGLLVAAFLVWWIGRAVLHGSWTAAVVPAVCILGGVAQTLWRRRVRRERGGAIQFAFSSRGAFRRRGPGQPEFIPWSEFRRIKFRRAGRDAWRLRLTRGRWPFCIQRSMSRTLTGRPWIEGVVECSRREAAAIRGEIRRRMRALHR